MTTIDSRPQCDPRPDWKVEPYTWMNHFELVLDSFNLKTQLTHELVKATRYSPHAEICGLIDTQMRPHFIINDHPEPQHNFKMEEASFRRAVELICVGGDGILGCFHSHPQGPPTPSKGDLEGWPDTQYGWKYFIVTINGVFEYRKI